MAALTTSQSATTKSIVPIGVALAIPAQFMIGMWPSLIGVYFLPANGTQLAAVAIDRTGTTKIGNAVLNHSFMPNVIFMWIVAILLGMAIGGVIYGTGSSDPDPVEAATPAPEASAAPTESPIEEPTEAPTEEATQEATESPTEAATEVATEAADTPTPEVSP
jgi:hypothetical protein